jgi:hypothetical protein
MKEGEEICVKHSPSSVDCYVIIETSFIKWWTRTESIQYTKHSTIHHIEISNRWGDEWKTKETYLAPVYLRSRASPRMWALLCQKTYTATSEATNEWNEVWLTYYSMVYVRSTRKVGIKLNKIVLFWQGGDRIWEVPSDNPFREDASNRVIHHQPVLIDCMCVCVNNDE